MLLNNDIRIQKSMGVYMKKYFEQLNENLSFTDGVLKEIKKKRGFK